MAPTPRKRGPKPRPVATTRRQVIRVMVTDAEFKRIRAAVQPIPVSTWIRSLVLEALESAEAKKK